MAPYTRKSQEVVKCLCGSCRKVVTARCRALQCDFCNIWYHLRCNSKITLDIYTILRKYECKHLPYRCKTCSDKAHMGHPGSKEVMTMTESVNKGVTDRSTQTRSSQTRFIATQVDSRGLQTKDTSQSVRKPTNAAKQNKSHDETQRQNKSSSNEKPTPSCSRTHFMHLLDKNTTEYTKLPINTNGVPNSLNPTPNPKNMVIFNLPEVSSISLAAREQEEQKSVLDMGKAVGVNFTKPIRLVRLNWRKEGPRPLRVETEEPDCRERLMVLSAVLNTENPNRPRITSDIPWSEREKRRRIRATIHTNNALRARSIILHGIPQSSEQSELEQLKSDLEQWCYIRTKLSLPPEVTRACSIQRLPRPVHLNGITAPRLLRVTLATSDMASAILNSWEQARTLFPSSIRLHPDIPRDTRIQSRQPPRISSPVISLEADCHIETTDKDVPKNARWPTMESA